MPTIELIKKLPKSTHYNSRWIADRYDIDVDKFTKEWRFSFQFPKQWSVGLIVGNSGSGKSCRFERLHRQSRQPSKRYGSSL